MYQRWKTYILMGFYKQHNKVWQMQIAGKDTTALQTPPNVKWSSLVYYGERGVMFYKL